jgi:6-phosphogluconolactonase
MFKLRLAGLVLVAWMSMAAAAQAAPFAYVTNAFSNSVSQYDIGANGALSPLVPPSVPAGSSPAVVAVSPDAKSVYVTNNDRDGSVSQYDIQSDGTLSPKSTASVATGGFPQGIAVSPDGKSAYVADEASSDVAQYDIGADGGLTPKATATVPTGGLPWGVAIGRDGKSVYVSTLDGVYQYDVGSDGALSPKSPSAVPAGSSPREITVSPDGQSVYVANQVSNDVSQYSVGPNGALTPKTPAAVADEASPYEVAISPDGKSAWVTNNSGHDVSQWDVGAAGALTPKDPARVSASPGDPFEIAVSPDGKSVYVAGGFGGGSSPVLQYDVGSGGLLSAKTPPIVPAESLPYGIAVTPANRPPDCSGVRADPAKLFPPTHQFTTIRLVGARDPDGDPLRFHIDRVSQDEPVVSVGDPTAPDARLTRAGTDSNKVEVRAELSPLGNGRVYRIAYTVSDGHGNSCSRTLATTDAKVSVPRTANGTAVDSAPPSYDSFGGRR